MLYDIILICAYLHWYYVHVCSMYRLCTKQLWLKHEEHRFWILVVETSVQVGDTYFSGKLLARLVSALDTVFLAWKNKTQIDEARLVAIADELDQSNEAPKQLEL